MHNIQNLNISSTNPCLIIYLLDQSGSMEEPFGNTKTSKAVEVANAMNEIIYETGLRCIDNDGNIKNRFEFAVIGYGIENDIVKSAWEGPLAGKWVVSIKNIFDFHLGIENDKPIWITPRSGGNTPMTKAFENAKRLCNDWINWGNHRDCHPPIIINITDGASTDSGFFNNSLKREISQIKSLRTNYGETKIFNIHISSLSSEKTLFPETIGRLETYQELLFEISSPLDENMIRIARSKGYSIQNRAKGYVFNGNATDLINFLNIGTPH